MDVNIHAPLASGHFGPVADDIRASTRSICNIIEQDLPPADVDIVIRDGRFRFIPEWG
jgi:hypothetical protein